MKISRASYPFLFAFFLYGAVLSTIGQFSWDLRQKLFLPVIIASVILFIIGIIVAIKDKEFIHMMVDERTQKVDRSAGYCSWWVTVIFVIVAGFLADVLKFTVSQLTFLILSEMFFSIILFHMYFNFKGEF